MMTQALELQKKPHIIIATPGRLVDHIQSSSGAVNLSKLSFLVMDEADRLLEPGFAQDLAIILKQAPLKRQTLLFSATMTPDIQALQFSKKVKPFVYQCAER